MIKAQCVGFLNTPPLWKKEQFGIQQFAFPNLTLDSFQPTSVPGNLRLGHQMEYVFKQLVTYSEAYQVVLYNLPIREEQKTLGEIDFILKDRIRDKLIHVELTYKFYIIDPEIAEPIHQLIGPNRRDTFFDKIEKIRNKQFSLLHTAAGAKALSNNHIDHSEIEHQCCFKAQLFQPFGSKFTHIGAWNEDCLTGYWLHFDDFNQPEFTVAQFYIPTKSEWAIEPNDQVDWRSHTEIIADVELRLLNKKAPMIWLKKPDAEFEKLFVVWW